LQAILAKNPGYKTLLKMYAVLNGTSPIPEIGEQDPGIIAKFVCAPVTTVDCKRCFSSFKDLLSSKRLHLTEAHICDHMIVQWKSGNVE